MADFTGYLLRSDQQIAEFKDKLKDKLPGYQEKIRQYLQHLPGTGSWICFWEDVPPKNIPYRGLLYNPHRYDHATKTALKTDKDGRPDLDDKANGQEYFMIGDPNYYEIVRPVDILSEDPFSDEMNFD